MSLLTSLFRNILSTFFSFCQSCSPCTNHCYTLFVSVTTTIAVESGHIFGCIDTIYLGMSAFPWNGTQLILRFLAFFKRIELFIHVCLPFYIKVLSVPRSGERERYTPRVHDMRSK